MLISWSFCWALCSCKFSVCVTSPIQHLLPRLYGLWLYDHQLWHILPEIYDHLNSAFDLEVGLTIHNLCAKYQSYTFCKIFILSYQYCISFLHQGPGPAQESDELTRCNGHQGLLEERPCNNSTYQQNNENWQTVAKGRSSFCVLDIPQNSTNNTATVTIYCAS